MHFKTDAFFAVFLKRCNNKVSRFALLSCHNMPHDPFCVRAKLDEDTHISTKTSKPGPVAFCEIEIYSFEVFGTFQLSFAYQSATKAVQSGQK